MNCVDRRNARGKEHETMSFVSIVGKTAENAELFARGSSKEMELFVAPRTRETATKDNDVIESKTVTDMESPTTTGFGLRTTLGVDTTKIDVTSCRLLRLQL